MADLDLLGGSHSRNIELSVLASRLKTYRAQSRWVRRSGNRGDKRLWLDLDRVDIQFAQDMFSDSRAIADALFVYEALAGYEPKLPRVTYVIAEAGDRFSKIGFSESPAQRLAALQSSSPRMLEIKGAFWSNESGRSLEMLALDSVEESGHRMRGEWCSLHWEAAVCRIIEVAKENEILIAPPGMFLKSLASAMPSSMARMPEEAAEEFAGEAFEEVSQRPNRRSFSVIR